MTTLETSLYVALVAPVLSIVVSIFSKEAFVQRWSALLLALSGIAGAVTGVYGAVAEEPLTQTVPVFYGMTVAIDRFSAIFFVGMSLAIAAAGIYGAYRQSNAPYHRGATVAAALLIIGAQWILLSGNIIGFLAAWAVMLIAAFSMVVIHVEPSMRQSIALRLFAVAQLSIMALAAGFFLLSSGALFSDFGTLAYLTAQATPLFLAIGYGLLLCGFVSILGAFPFICWSHRVLTQLPAHFSALVRAVLSTVALYGFIRCVLFILPALSVYFAIPVIAIGVLTMLIGAYQSVNAMRASLYAAHVSTHGFGLTMVMLGGAIAFQALAQYDAMNVLLFATFIQLTMSVITTSGLFLAADIGAHTKKSAIATLILLCCAVGLPPFATFTSLWMLASGFSSALALSMPITIIIIVTLAITIILSLISAFRFCIFALLPSLSSATIDAATPQCSDEQFAPIAVLAFFCVISGFALPQLLLALGADPLTDAAGTFNGGIVTSLGVLRMGIIGVAVAGVVAILWYFRAAWFDRLPSFASIEAQRARIAARCTCGNRCRKLFDRIREKFHR